MIELVCLVFFELVAVLGTLPLHDSPGGGFAKQ